MEEVDPQLFRRVMALWPTGVSVITGYGTDSQPRGMVVGSFCSVSLAPALIAFFVKARSHSWNEIMAGGGRFCVNVLSQDQTDLCRIFSSGDATARFDQVKFDPAHRDRTPRLSDCCAWIEARCISANAVGDHQMVLGTVERMESGRHALPLVFQRGRLSRAEALIEHNDDHFREWEDSLCLTLQI